MTGSAETGGVAVGKQVTVCVFCGSSAGSSPAYLEAARSLGEAFHANNIRLVYGGGTVGLMGEVARTLVKLAGPSSVHGIIPEALVRHEQAGKNPPESEYGRTTVVKDMHSRKALMAKEVLEGAPGSGFVALPGGYGTMEELMEVTTWNQLGIHSRPVIVFNVENCKRALLARLTQDYDGLIKWVNGAVDAGFVSKGNSGIIKAGATVQEVLDLLHNYQVAEGRLDLNWGNK